MAKPKQIRQHRAASSSTSIVTADRCNLWVWERGNVVLVSHIDIPPEVKNEGEKRKRRFVMEEKKACVRVSELTWRQRSNNMLRDSRLHESDLSCAQQYCQCQHLRIGWSRVAENLWDTQNKMLTSFLLCALAMATLVGAKTTHQECKAKQSKPTVSGSTDGR